MDSYVVHIYRRPDPDGGELAGLVERIGDGERRAFQSEAQLLEYLSMERSAPTRKAPSRKPSEGT